MKKKIFKFLFCLSLLLSSVSCSSKKEQEEVAPPKPIEFETQEFHEGEMMVRGFKPEDSFKLDVMGEVNKGYNVRVSSLEDLEFDYDVVCDEYCELKLSEEAFVPGAMYRVEVEHPDVYFSLDEEYATDTSVLIEIYKEDEFTYTMKENASFEEYSKEKPTSLITVNDRLVLRSATQYEIGQSVGFLNVEDYKNYAVTILEKANETNLENYSMYALDGYYLYMVEEIELNTIFDDINVHGKVDFQLVDVQANEEAIAAFVEDNRKGLEDYLAELGFITEVKALEGLSINMEELEDGWFQFDVAKTFEISNMGFITLALKNKMKLEADLSIDHWKFKYAELVVQDELTPEITFSSFEPDFLNISNEFLEGSINDDSLSIGKGDAEVSVGDESLSISDEIFGGEFEANFNLDYLKELLNIEEGYEIKYDKDISLLHHVWWYGPCQIQGDLVLRLEAELDSTYIKVNTPIDITNKIMAYNDKGEFKGSMQNSFKLQGVNIEAGAQSASGATSLVLIGEFNLVSESILALFFELGGGAYVDFDGYAKLSLPSNKAEGEANIDAGGRFFGKFSIDYILNKSTEPVEVVSASHKKSFPTFPRKIVGFIPKYEAMEMEPLEIEREIDMPELRYYKTATNGEVTEGVISPTARIIGGFDFTNIYSAKVIENNDGTHKIVVPAGFTEQNLEISACTEEGYYVDFVIPLVKEGMLVEEDIKDKDNNESDKNNNTSVVNFADFKFKSFDEVEKAIENKAGTCVVEDRTESTNMSECNNMWQKTENDYGWLQKIAYSNFLDSNGFVKFEKSITNNKSRLFFSVDVYTDEAGSENYSLDLTEGISNESQKGLEMIIHSKGGEDEVDVILTFSEDNISLEKSVGYGDTEPLNDNKLAKKYLYKFINKFFEQTQIFDEALGIQFADWPKLKAYLVEYSESLK